jgi:hypothetical protein
MNAHKVSVVLPAMLGYESVAAALEAWKAQTARDRIEIVVLCPSAPGGVRLPRGQVLIPTGQADLAEMRAIGVEQASGEYIMLAEDHCLPDPDWAQHILDCLDRTDCDAVGCALRPGNRTSCWPEGSFLLGYGQWMDPVDSGPADVICGWNGTIRASLVRAVPPAQLREDLHMGAFLMNRLHAQGAKFYIENRAKMSHYDPPGFLRQMGMICMAGMGFGSMRSRRWPWAARLLYPLLVPAVSCLHAKRAVTQYFRAGSAAGLRSNTLPAALLMAFLWGIGEGIGAWMGISRVGPMLWRIEVKPPRPQDVAHYSINQPVLAQE